MIAMYDLEDNLITVFNGYKDCAKYFNTSTKVIHCYISRSKKGLRDKKYNKQTKSWCRLYKIEDDE